MGSKELAPALLFQPRVVPDGVVRHVPGAQGSSGGELSIEGVLEERDLAWRSA
jgi:hypothetical protein